MPKLWTAFAAIGMLALPGIADAACSNGSGNGTWDFYATAVTGTTGWNRCSATVNNGNVSGSCVTNSSRNNTVRGKLTIANNCRVSGSLTHTFGDGSQYTVTSAQATLGAENRVIMGVGRTNTGQAVTVQGLRR
jgi:hypothetical protein